MTFVEHELDKFRKSPPEVNTAAGTRSACRRSPSRRPARRARLPRDLSPRPLARRRLDPKHLSTSCRREPMPCRSKRMPSWPRYVSLSRNTMPTLGSFQGSNVLSSAFLASFLRFCSGHSAVVSGASDIARLRVRSRRAVFLQPKHTDRPSGGEMLRQTGHDRFKSSFHGIC